MIWSVSALIWARTDLSSASASTRSGNDFAKAELFKRVRIRPGPNIEINMEAVQ